MLSVNIHVGEPKMKNEIALFTDETSVGFPDRSTGGRKPIFAYDKGNGIWQRML